MHDLGFEHIHLTAAEKEQVSSTIWAADNVELTTVGVDIGSSTSHLMFAHVHLQRLAEALSSRFVVAERKILWRSPIRLTPYSGEDTIDAGALADFVDEAYRAAGLSPEDIDSGAVILTGVALLRRNARAIAELFAADAGKFVCASAGHHLESAMAAHGSGAVALSRARRQVILNVDIGGGTAKLALIDNGVVRATSAIGVGGRLVVFGADGTVRRIEPAAAVAANAAGIALARGQTLAAPARASLAQCLTEILVAQMRRALPTGLAADLMLTEPLPAAPALDAITLSGGVSEYLFGREAGRFGDLGADLAAALARALGEGQAPAQILDPCHGIRATVIGASQFTVQVSGNTIAVPDPQILPLRNLPVLTPRLDLGCDVSAAAVAHEIGHAMQRLDLNDGNARLALAIRWQGEPSHRRLHALAAGISQALRRSLAGPGPVVLLVDGDVGMSLGRLMAEELDAKGKVIAVDGVRLSEFDYVDVGEVIQPTNVVPVVIKSLLFSGG